MRRGLAATWMAVALSCPAVVYGQRNDDVARADALFNAAKALLDGGQYVDACTKFAESKRLAPGLGVTLYLADCYERIGRTASSWAEFRSAEGLARERNDKRADVARGRAQTLEATLDRLTIAVAATVSQAGLQVLRDGMPVPQEQWGVAVPVDPGDHVVVVTSPGRPPRTLTAHVGPDNRTATIRIDSLDESTTATPTSVPTPTSTSTSTSTSIPWTSEPVASDPGATRRWVGLGAMGVGVVGLGVGSAFGLTAMSKLNQSNSGPCNAQDHCNGEGLSLRQSASSEATVSTVAFIAGGVAVAAGIVLYVTAPRAPTSARIVVAPTPMAGGGGALLRATF